MGVDEVQAVIRKDAPTVSSNVDEFVKLNLLGYYILCNSWLMLIKEYSVYGWMRVAEAFRRNGLIAVIKTASDTADEVVRAVSITNTLWRSISYDLTSSIAGKPHYGGAIGQDTTATLLAVLRYPKRFSPLGNDLIQQASLNDFIAVENRSKLIQRREYSPWLMSYLKAEAERYCDWDSLCKEIMQSLSEFKCEFSNGVGFDSRANLGSKLMAVAKDLPEFFPAPFGIPNGLIPTVDSEWWGNGEQVRDVRVAAVPKSYKASRIIAMEYTSRQALARSVMNIIDKYMPKSADIHRQDVNQKLAYWGSTEGGLATLDLSHASDCITKTLFRSMLPSRFVELVDPLLGTHTVIDGKRRLMQQMSTAGNSLTFVLETMIFHIIVKAATTIYSTFGGDPILSVTMDASYAIPSVYGDDIVVDSQAAPTVIDVLTALGFVVNESKSYIDGPFRESCGKDYYEGVDVSSIYFPRFPIEGSLDANKVSFSPKAWRDSFTDEWSDSIASVISLQHRLYGVSYPAARFLYEIVMEGKPSMTTSPHGSFNSDLWEYEERCKLRFPPAAQISTTVSYLPFKRERKMEKMESPREITLQSGEILSLERRLHLVLSTKYSLKKEDVSAYKQRLLDLYNYRRFLEEGPRYADPLMRLLGITEKPISALQAYGTKEFSWILSETTD
jgi:hypothetical protein